jgi:hypothetical protein
MESNSQTVFDAAIKLPESEQVALVSRLLEHLSPRDILCSIDDPALIDELDRRSADDEGSVPWSELKAES